MRLIIVSFFLLNLLTLFIAPRLLPYLGSFPYGDFVNQYHIPQFLAPLANFDGVLYLRIAQNGYSQYEQAFFPFYPLAIRLFSLLTHNHFLSALLISNLSFILSLYLLRRLLLKLKVPHSNWVLLFYCFFPTSYYFSAVYTESLFLLLLLLSFIKPIFSIFASATRLIGLFLAIPLKSLLPLVGFAAYSYYLYRTTGDFLFFFHAQPYFGANRSTNLILLPQVAYRYLKIFFLADHNFQYFIALLEFLIFFLFFFILLYQLFTRRYLPLTIFSLLSLLLPTLTGTFQSVPRYILICLPVFFAFAQIKSSLLRYLLLFTFILLRFFLFSFFIQGYFVS